MSNPQETLEPKLEPCPFCGGPAEQRLTDGPKRGFIGCFSCMIGTPFNVPYGEKERAQWNTRIRDSTAATVDYGALHWQSKSGAEETMCGRLAKDVRCTVLQDFATCETCKAVAFGYQMGRADERAASPVALRDEARPRAIFDSGFAAPSSPRELAQAAAEEIWKRIHSEKHLTLPNQFEIAAIIERCLAAEK